MAVGSCEQETYHNCFNRKYSDWFKIVKALEIKNSLKIRNWLLNLVQVILFEIDCTTFFTEIYMNCFVRS